MKKIERIWKKIEKGIEVVCNILSVIGTISLVAMMLVVFIDVFMRSILHRTLFLGTTEMAQVTFLCMLTGVPLVILRNSNTMVDIFVNKFPRRLRRVVNFITVLATAVILVLIGWQMIESGNYAAKFNVAYTMSRIPQSIVYYVFGISCFFMVIACLVILVREWIADGPTKSTGEQMPAEQPKEVE